VIASEVLGDELFSISFSLASKEKTKWLDVKNDEMNSLHLNNTWTLVCIPIDFRLVSCKWIFNHGNPEIDQTY